MVKRKSKRVYKKLIVSGLVQGIGFRPYIKRIADKYNAFGYVKNCGGYVEIEISIKETDFLLFINEIKSCNIEITTHKCASMQNKKEFIIEESEQKKSNDIIISPDLAICRECIEELFDENNRRYKYALNSCTACGPRFSILKDLPYDRENTAMSDFIICNECKKEYTDINNRRFHAQTISCFTCLTHKCELHKCEPHKYNSHILKEKMADIFALKGIGGYNFCCSPYDDNSVLKLREIKNRDKKPFAVMFSSLDEIKKVCCVSDKEEELLVSNAHPIVLLKFKKNEFSKYLCFNSAQCGCFLPSTPLQALLLNEYGALVMTSANISSNPIITEDNQITIPKIYHDRKILRPIDDSVSRVIDNDVQILRRSRGYVPLPVYIENPEKLEFLSVGGDLKSSFCLVKNNNAYVSQYFGDLENEKVFENYRNEYQSYKKLFQIEPQFVVCDYHKNYFSTEFAENCGLPVFYVQHHHAHAASVMAEYNLDNAIGVVFDGTGMGLDGNIWGGEFFICKNSEFIRHSHLKYKKLINNIKDTKKIADCYMGTNDLINRALENNINTFITSSMGRLFDAVSSILGICHYNSYEGEAAILLEQAAKMAVKSIDFKFDILENEICFDNLLNNLKDNNKNSVSLGFHIAVANMVLENCINIRKENDLNTVVLAGGVFQNELLLNLCIEKLRRENFFVYINRKVPPNDQSIALGQANAILYYRKLHLT